jgi:hypothetical protein
MSKSLPKHWHDVPVASDHNPLITILHLADTVWLSSIPYLASHGVFSMLGTGVLATGMTDVDLDRAGNDRGIMTIVLCPKTMPRGGRIPRRHARVHVQDDAHAEGGCRHVQDDAR